MISKKFYLFVLLTFLLFFFLFKENMVPRIVVLVSGNGSNLQAIIDAINSKTLNGEIALVVSNKKSAYGLTRATQAKIPTLTFPLKPYKDLGKTRIEYDIDLAKKIKEYNPNLIVMAGWMHILSEEFLNLFEAINIINLHPALPNQFDGIIFFIFFFFFISLKLF
jgi:formyltetrahydrofolate-dependent phosphoribosylglycinamide formyltransferase